MYEFMKLENDLSNAVNEAYIALKYTNSISTSCYYGLIVYGFDITALQDVYESYNFLENAMFNAGFIWTDIVMLLVGYYNKGDPTTDTNWFYYMSYYTGDLIFRFIFMADTADEGNCWYPWVVCETETALEVEEDDDDE
jgi:hypothetical protein